MSQVESLIEMRARTVIISRPGLGEFACEAEFSPMISFNPKWIMKSKMVIIILLSTTITEVVYFIGIAIRLSEHWQVNGHRYKLCYSFMHFYN